MHSPRPAPLAPSTLNRVPSRCSYCAAAPTRVMDGFAVSNPRRVFWVQADSSGSYRHVRAPRRSRDHCQLDCGVLREHYYTHGPELSHPSGFAGKRTRVCTAIASACTMGVCNVCCRTSASSSVHGGAAKVQHGVTVQHKWPSSASCLFSLAWASPAGPKMQAVPDTVYKMLQPQCRAKPSI